MPDGNEKDVSVYRLISRVTRYTEQQNRERQ